jgi:hypothetical protein
MAIYKPYIPKEEIRKCIRGHIMDRGNIAINRINGLEYEICRICRNEKSREYQKRTYRRNA